MTDTINEPALTEHIDRVGIEFYSRWKKYKFSEILIDESISYGIVQPGTHTEIDSVPIIRVNNIKDGYIKTEDAMKVSSSIEEKFLRTRLVGGELLITVVGSVGECAIVPENLKGWNVARAVSVARIKSEFNVKYIKYAFKTDDIIFQMYGNTNDTVQPTLNLSLLKELYFTLPSLSEQTAIANILSSLDDKIELLHRQNKTLEQLAETLFRQWFVEEAEESWKVGKLEDVITVKGGTTPSTTNADFWDGDINWTTPRDLSNATSVFLFSTERKITKKGLAQIGSGLLPVGTVLLSSRAPIGYLTITEIPVAINQGYIAIISDKQISNYYIYLWCKANMETIENAGNGSVFQEISKSSFKGLEIVIPPNSKLKHFDNEIKPIFQKIRSNQKQIRTLTQLRDTLLPKLMSGEVRVKM